MTHRAIEIVVEPALNPAQLFRNAWGVGWGGRGGAGQPGSLVWSSAKPRVLWGGSDATPVGAFPSPPTDGASALSTCVSQLRSNSPIVPEEQYQPALNQAAICLNFSPA